MNKLLLMCCLFALAGCGTGKVRPDESGVLVDHQKVNVDPSMYQDCSSLNKEDELANGTEKEIVEKSKVWFQKYKDCKTKSQAQSAWIKKTFVEVK